MTLIHTNNWATLKTSSEDRVTFVLAPRGTRVAWKKALQSPLDTEAGSPEAPTTYRTRTLSARVSSPTSCRLMPLRSPRAGYKSEGAMNARETSAAPLPRRNLLLGAATSLAGIAAFPEMAQAAGVSALTAEELAALRKTSVVSRQFEFRHRGRDYLGALSYSGIARPAEAVWQVLTAPSTFPRAWPNTRGASFADSAHSRLNLHQGSSVVDVHYSVFWRPDELKREIHYWMDRTRPTDFRDTFGFFRIRPDGDQRSVLSVGLALDPGSSLAALLFRGMIHDYMVRPARWIARYMHERTPATDTRIAGT